MNQWDVQKLSDTEKYGLASVLCLQITVITTHYPLAWIRRDIKTHPVPLSALGRDTFH